MDDVHKMRWMPAEHWWVCPACGRTDETDERGEVVRAAIVVGNARAAHIRDFSQIRREEEPLPRREPTQARPTGWTSNSQWMQRMLEEDRRLLEGDGSGGMEINAPSFWEALTAGARAERERQEKARAEQREREIERFIQGNVQDEAWLARFGVTW